MRTLLTKFDERNGAYASRVGDHPELGRLDYTHLPLKVVHRICPDDFEKIRMYHAFALIRDPRARFVSALSQRLKMYSPRELAQHNRSEVNQLAMEVVEALQKPDTTLNPEFVHFSKQSDFIFCDGERLVETVYPTSKIDFLIRDFSKLTGELGQVGTENPTMVFRSEAFRRLAIAGKRVSEKALGPGKARAARNVARRVMMKPLKGNLGEYKLSDEVNDFVQEYYSDDFNLYNEIMKSFDQAS